MKLPNFVYPSAGSSSKIGLDFSKGQLISKTNCQAKDFSKKRTNEFVFTSMRRIFVRFFEESSARKKTFRDYLTFTDRFLQFPTFPSSIGNLAS